jgi:hypothetical protein
LRGSCATIVVLRKGIRSLNALLLCMERADMTGDP